MVHGLLQGPVSKEREPKVFVANNRAIIGSFDAVCVTAARGIEVIPKEISVKERVTLSPTGNIEARDLFLENFRL